MKFEGYLKHRILVITKDKRNFEGILYGFDVHKNLILVDTLELYKDSETPRGLGMIILKGCTVQSVSSVAAPIKEMDLPSHFVN